MVEELSSAFANTEGVGVRAQGCSGAICDAIIWLSAEQHRRRALGPLLVARGVGYAPARAMG
eukprot:2472353-Lingulodinium_polyedra.AAC.1